MRFLAIFLLALFIGGCARYNVRTTFDREGGTETVVESRGVSMNPEANIHAVSAHQQGAVHADAYHQMGGYWGGGMSMTDMGFHYPGGIVPAPSTDMERRLMHLESDVEETRDGVDGVAESQRRLVDGLRGRGGER
ncbi:MAG: hypothetical protein U9Q03_01095 [Patescibacteria group bacterium]|nr:hypothetical protein [Patescibacteria group bacterium]